MSLEHAPHQPEREIQPDELRPLLGRVDELLGGLVGNVSEAFQNSKKERDVAMRKGAQFPLLPEGSITITQSQTNEYTNTNLLHVSNMYNEGGYTVQKISELFLMQQGSTIAPQYLLRSKLLYGDMPVEFTALDKLRMDTERSRNPYAVDALGAYDALPNSNAAQRITERVMGDFQFDLNMADPDNRRVIEGVVGDFTIPDLAD